MKDKNLIKPKQKLIRKCHVCGHTSESFKELERCLSCDKSFLPLNYFAKIHEGGEQRFADLFSASEDLDESQLIRGLFVLWR